MKKFIYFLLISTYSLSSEGAKISPKNCGFYKQFSTQLRCGSGENYLEKYGEKYCDKFLSQRKEGDGWSQQAIKWSEESSVCLQEMLLHNPQRFGSNCSHLKSFAFDSHPICYKQYGFCNLNIEEKIKIAKIVSAEDICQNLSMSLTQILNVGVSCFNLKELFSALGEATFYRISLSCAARTTSKSFRDQASKIIQLMPTNPVYTKLYFDRILPLLLFKKMTDDSQNAMSLYNPRIEKERFQAKMNNSNIIESTELFRRNSPSKEIELLINSHSDFITPEQMEAAAKEAELFNSKVAAK